ncbi:MAG: hypothetical protein IT261_13415 [Saprospiraceae bacterium]|nr:hypothetical protein [Saprospiraceae bacterium]
MKIAELRRNLEAQLREGQLPEALQAFLAAMPEGTETYRIVSALIARLNAANKERFRNTISFEEYQRRVDQISADCFDLLAGLKEEDLLPPAPSEISGAARTGTVLYRVPNVMQIRKSVRCVVRVAVNEETILENILLDEHVELKSKVEISDVMSAELLDPEGGAFQISALNARTQLIRETGFTEWNFQVTPLKEGVHQLLVKVSIMEIVPGFQEPIPREVTLLETVTILTELPERQHADDPGGGFKPSGQTFGIGQEPSYAPQMEGAEPKGAQPAPPAAPPPPPAPAAPSSTVPMAPPQSAAPRRQMRALAYVLALLVLVPAATWAFAPDLPAWVSAHYLEGTPEAYASFIEKHPESPRLEKAYYLRAEKSGQLADLRAYQSRFQDKGIYRAQVIGQIAALESRALDRIRENPDKALIREFALNFPETERLSDLKEAAETRSESRQDLQAVLEDVYITAVRRQPTEAKIEAYLRDFPETPRLEEVETAARTRPEVFSKVQPKLEEAYLKKMEEDPTRVQSEQFIHKFPEPSKREKLERILDKKPALKRETIQKLEEIKAERRSMIRDSAGHKQG